jgi:two-component system response regulator
MGRADAIDVLLVEDNRDDAEFTLRALRKANAGLRVQLVEDGVAALEFLFRTGQFAGQGSDRPPRLVLLDLNLPKLDGTEVLRRMRADPRTRTVPVVMLTSSSAPADVQRAYRCGANSYIVKPDDYPQLIALLADLVRYWLQINAGPGDGIAIVR